MWIVRLFWDYVVVLTKFKSFIIFVGTFTHHYFTFLANTNYPLGKKTPENWYDSPMYLIRYSISKAGIFRFCSTKIVLKKWQRKEFEKKILPRKAFKPLARWNECNISDWIFDTPFLKLILDEIEV